MNDEIHQPKERTIKYRKEFEILVDDIEQYKSTLVSQKQESDKYLQNIKSTKSQIDNYMKDIDSYYKSLFEGGDDNYSIKEDIELSQKRADEVYKSTQELKNKLFGYDAPKNVPVKIDEISDIPEDELIKIDENYFRKTTILEPGIEQKIEDYVKEIEKIKESFDPLYKSQQDSFDSHLKLLNKEFSSLKKEVEDLMPTAMSASLSSAYQAAKKSLFWHEMIWLFVNALSLIGVGAAAAVYFSCFSIEVKTITDFWLNILRLLPAEGALIWLAYISNVRIKEISRLTEEYRHKWAVAFSYEGLKREALAIDEKDTDKIISNGLLDKVITAYEKNPSDAINPKAALPAEKMVKMLLDGMSEIIKKFPGSQNLPPSS